ncbi:hypothetical protein Q604_UNBC13363G0001, partial [human gut metagenome]
EKNDIPLKLIERESVEDLIIKT